MKMVKGFLAAFFLLAFVASPAPANDSLSKAKKLCGKAVTCYNPTYKCMMICKGKKPFLAHLEDGLAFALDIPLAILSPITCPIVAPLMHRFDSGEDRTYSRSRKRK